jgi:hypothetical protein
MQFGASSNFEMQYNSTSAQLEIEDRVNSAIASIPTGRSGDLVDGRFSETIAEGKALADSGEVFDSIQNAVDAASSYVRVGPGTFRESVTIDTPGLSLVGSGDRTVIDGERNGIALSVSSSNVTIKDISVRTTNVGKRTNAALNVESSSGGVEIINVTIPESGNAGIQSLVGNVDVFNCNVSSYYNGIVVQNNSIVANNAVTRTTDAAAQGIFVNSDDVIVSGNTVQDTGAAGIIILSPDNIIIRNVVRNTRDDGIRLRGNSIDNIVGNNRITGSSGAAIDDDGTGTILDGNLTG